MAKKLTRTVFVDGVAYGPSSELPKAVAAKITNPKVWADADASAPAPAEPAGAVTRGDDEPPSEDWNVRELKDFAKAQGIALGEARAKAQILAVLAEAGHGVEPEGEGGAEESEDGADEEPEADSPEDVDESDES